MENIDNSSNGGHRGNASEFSIDKNKIDLRVFLIPQNESTLGHYLAMYDDLYC